MVLVEDCQRRQEKLLASPPSQLGEINVQLQMLLTQRAAHSTAKTSAQIGRASCRERVCVGV